MILLAIVLTANVMMAQKKDRTDAFMYNKNQQYDKAMVSIEKCVNHEQFLGQKPEWQAEAWHYRAIIYQNVLSSGDEKLLAQAPNALEIVYESLMKCMENKSFLEDNKDDIYQRVDVVKSNYYSKGFSLYEARNYSEAAAMFKKSYDIAKMLGTPDANDMLNAAAQASLLAKDYQTALEYFTELKDNGVETGDIYRHLATCYSNLGNNEMAMEMINTGIEKNPDDGNLVIEKVNAYVKEGREEEAIEDINKLIALDPNNASFYYVLGNIYSNEEKSVYDVDKTIENYTRALEINPDYYDAVYNLGVFYTSLANKRIEEANNITGISKAEIAQYDALIEQANDLLRTGLPYLQKAYQTQPSDDVKSVLKSIYVKLNMTDELKALEEQ